MREVSHDSTPGKKIFLIGLFFVFSLLDTIHPSPALVLAADLSAREETINKALDRAEAFSRKGEQISPSSSTYPLSREQTPQVNDSAQKHVSQAIDHPKKQSPQKGSSFKRDNIVASELDRIEFEFNFSPGLRRDEVQWSIADTDGSPNVLSELTWKDLYIAQIGGRAKLTWDKAIRLEGAIDYGWILDGKNQDSDYLLDDRDGEFSRSNNDSDGDNVFDTSAGIGYQFSVPTPEEWDDFLTDDLWIALLGGYSYHEQNLRMTDGFQTIPATGSFAGLDSTYQIEWEGPWAGIELFGYRDKFRGFSRFEYHWTDYYGVGNWNLRTDFAHPKSFEQWAEGRGLVFSFGGDLAVNSDLEVGLKFDIQHWETKSGIDQTNYADGSQLQGPFNRATWESYAGMLSATYHFNVGQGRQKQDSLEGILDQGGEEH